MNDELLTKYMLGESSPKENSLVENWLLKHQENAKYYDQFKQIWESSLVYGEFSSVNEQEAWQRFKIRRDKQDEVKINRLVYIYTNWLKIAAVLIVAFGAGLIIYQKNFTTTFPVDLRASSAVRCDTLPDGSVVTLNKQSAIKLSKQFNDEKRELELLEGEAFFDVRPNPSKPFIVRIGNIQVRVTGTSFNIKSRDGSTEVIVEKGHVEVMKKQVLIRLKPLEKVTSSSPESDLKKDVQPDQLYKFYVNGELTADETPLWRIAEVFSEVYDVKVQIENENIRHKPITTTFKLDKPITENLKVISETLKVNVETRDGQIFLR